jgi:integrase
MSRDMCTGCPARKQLIAQDCHPKVVQEHLGHSSIVITMDRYGHLYPEDRSKVANALDAAFATGREVTA